MYESKQYKREINRRTDGGDMKRQNIKFDRHKYSLATPMQMFAVPADLEVLKRHITEVQNDISITKFTFNNNGQEKLYGSEEWAKDTKWAALRKLDEWNLVKELVTQGGGNDSFVIGFGIDDRYEPDGLMYDNSREVVLAGENKVVTGGFPQLRENINSALSQLCIGNRARCYSGAKLLARIAIKPESSAYQHLKQMNKQQQQAICTRWRHRVESFYHQGIDSGIWKKYPQLTLQIHCLSVPQEQIFEYNYYYD